MTYDLNILFTTNNPTEEDVRAYFLFGGYFSKVFKGNIETTLMEYNDLFNNEEMGINWGLGMDVFFMQVGFTQKIGATYLNKTSNMTDLVNISSYFTLGFTF